MQKPSDTLRVLHTADWHIGKRLKELTRYDDFEAFLTWVLGVVDSHQVDILIVAGDIFDTMTPSNKAQELYYSFLGRLGRTHLRHVVIVAGNHDSPSFLDAPKSLLGAMGISVIGTPSDEPSDEILTLSQDGTPYAIIAAVPYLRDRDIRTVQFGESLKNKEDNARMGIKKHYAKISTLCIQKQADILATHKVRVPIIATGHLFATGAERASDNDGMRELYVGGLGMVGIDCFDGFDYVALGHIHKAQKIGGAEHIRYSGSPMMFNFGETGQKCVLLVDFDKDNATPAITVLPTPIFRQMIDIKGDVDSLIHSLKELVHTHKDSQKDIWVKAVYTGETMVSNLSEKLHQITEDTPVSVLIVSTPNQQKKSYQNKDNLNLNQLTPSEVFAQCLHDNRIEAPLKDELTQAYHHLLQSLHETDHFAY